VTQVGRGRGRMVEAAGAEARSPIAHGVIVDDRLTELLLRRGELSHVEAGEAETAPSRDEFRLVLFALGLVQEGLSRFARLPHLAAQEAADPLAVVGSEPLGGIFYAGGKSASASECRLRVPGGVATGPHHRLAILGL
jgi:hypothetical protein